MNTGNDRSLAMQFLIAACLAMACHAAAAAALGAAQPSAQAASVPNYVIRDLGVKGIASNVDSRGEIGLTVQQDRLTRYPAIYDHGTLTKLSATGGVEAFGPTGDAAGYNADDQVVFWPKGGDEMAIPPLKGKRSLIATAINGSRLVVGYFDLTRATTGCFTWTATEGTRDLHFPPGGGKSCKPVAVNDRGQIAGYATVADGQSAAFIHQGNRFHLLPRLAGSFGCEATDMNQKGDVVGYCYDQEFRFSPVLWHDKQPVNLVPGVLYDDYSGPLFINDKGVIVGTLDNGGIYEFDILTPEGPVNLDTLIQNLHGWHLAYIEGINNKGEIVGIGKHRDVESYADKVIRLMPLQ